MRPVAVAVLGRGIVDPDSPVLAADDAGLARGQAAFETLRVYGGRTFALGEHLERLRASALRLELPDVPRDALEDLAAQALEASGLRDASLRFYWTGGRDGAREATAIATVTPIPDDLEAARALGASASSAWTWASIMPPAPAHRGCWVASSRRATQCTSQHSPKPAVAMRTTRCCWHPMAPCSRGRRATSGGRPGTASGPPG